VLDASLYKELFLRVLSQAEDQTLRGYAARMLGFSKDVTVVPHLQQLLSDDQSFVAEQAAWSLARLDACHTIRDIEEAFHRFLGAKHRSGFIYALAHFHQPGSLPVIIAALESKHHAFDGDLIRACGAFLPDPAAEQIIVERLETWEGGHHDSGNQLASIRALAEYAPNLLLARVRKLYDQGHLYESTREELSRWIPHLSCQPGVDKQLLLEIVALLISDLYFPVRDLAGQALGLIDPQMCLQVYENISQVADETGWKQASAIYSLGYWDSDESKIHAARFDTEFIVRYAADAALQIHYKRTSLKNLVEMYRSTDGRMRLAAYLALKEQGNEQVIALLNETITDVEPAKIFLRQLTHSISERGKKDRKDRWNEEKKILTSTGVAWFD
jgi:hypothetical protein